MTYETSTFNKNSIQSMPRIFKKVNIPNSLKINNSSKKFIINNYKKRSIDLSENINEIKKYKDSYEDRNEIQTYDILKGKTRDDKLNMAIKYIEIDMNLKPKRIDNDNNKNIYIVDNNVRHTIKGKLKDNNSMVNENNEDAETFSNNNMQNELTIHDIIDTNKETEERMNNIKCLLSKIIQNKINVEEKYNYELLKKYFKFFKQDNNKKQVSYIKKKYSRDISGNIYNRNDFLFKKKFFSDKKKINKTGTEIVNGESQTINRSGGKFRVVTKKYSKTILNNQIKKMIPIRLSKNSFPEIFNVNNAPYKKQINKSISLTINENNEILNNNNIINKNIIQELIGNNLDKNNNIQIKKEKKDIINVKEKNNEISKGKDKELVQENLKEKIKVNEENEEYEEKEENKEEEEKEEEEKEEKVDNDEKEEK